MIYFLHHRAYSVAFLSMPQQRNIFRGEKNQLKYEFSRMVVLKNQLTVYPEGEKFKMYLRFKFEIPSLNRCMPFSFGS